MQPGILMSFFHSMIFWHVISDSMILSVKEAIFFGSGFLCPACFFLLNPTPSRSFSGNAKPNCKAKQDSTTSTEQTSLRKPGTSFIISEADTSVNSHLKSFVFSDLKNATKSFRPENLLGEGGFGCVFKGWIDENTFAPTKPGTGIVVAIKKLKPESFQGHKEWLVCAKWIVEVSCFLPFGTLTKP